MAPRGRYNRRHNSGQLRRKPAARKKLSRAGGRSKSKTRTGPTRATLRR